MQKYIFFQIRIHISPFLLRDFIEFIVHVLHMKEDEY